MGSYGWGTVHPLEDWLFEEGYRFDFYQAVRLLEMIYPNKLSVGEAAEPHHEVVRFRSRVSLTFPASEVRDVHPAENGTPAEMTVSFMGLAGIHGPLPVPYTELVLERARARDTAMRDFLDMFNHRLVSLMYRVRKLHRLSLHTGSPDRSPLAAYLYSFIGMGTRGLQGRSAVRDRSLLFYGGIFAQKPRSMAGLETVVADYFGIPVRGVQLSGAWIELEEDQTTAIGLSGRNQVLGEGAIVGRRVWDQRRKFDLLIGPLHFDQFLRFLPDGDAHEPLAALVRLYAGDEFEWELTLSVRPETIPGLALSSSTGARLGWTSWFSVDAARKDPSHRYEIRIEPRTIPTSSTNDGPT